MALDIKRLRLDEEQIGRGMPSGTKMSIDWLLSFTPYREYFCHTMIASVIVLIVRRIIGESLIDILYHPKWIDYALIFASMIGFLGFEVSIAKLFFFCIRMIFKLGSNSQNVILLNRIVI